MQGVRVDTISTGGAQLASASFLAKVGADGHLKIEIKQGNPNTPNDVVSLHGLRIVPRPKPFTFQFGTDNITPASGYDLVTNNSFYNSSLGQGLDSASTSVNANAISVFGNELLFKIDLVNGIYKVVLNLSGTSDSVSISYLSPNLKQMGSVQTGSNGTTTTFSFDAIVTSGYLTIDLHGIGGVAGIANLSLIPLGIVGDYNGDGKADFSVFDPATATFYVLYSGSGFKSQQYGNYIDTIIPLAGDYDGDGKTDYGIYDRTVSAFFVLLSSGGSIGQTFGTASDSNFNVPLIGDFDGDGKTDFAIYDQKIAVYSILPSKRLSGK